MRGLTHKRGKWFQKRLSIPKNLKSVDALRALSACRTVFRCVDHDGPRLILMELCAAYGATLIDAPATSMLRKVPAGVRRPSGGFFAGVLCLDCAGEIDKEVAKAELETPLKQEVRRAHGYGLGRHGPAPSVFCINGACEKDG